MAGELTTLGLARGRGIVNTGGGSNPPAGFEFLTEKNGSYQEPLYEDGERLIELAGSRLTETQPIPL